MRNGSSAGGESDTESPPPHVSQRLGPLARQTALHPARTGPDRTGPDLHGTVH